MTRPEAIKLALSILRLLAEESIYEDFRIQGDYTDEQFKMMLGILDTDDPASRAGPWSVLYEADGNVFRIGPFDCVQNAEQAATNANAQGEYDINDQQVYLVGPIIA